jgi:hypothetical protein
MDKDQMVYKLRQAYPTEEAEAILEIVFQIPNKALDVLQDIMKSEEIPERTDGTPIRGEYQAQTRTIILYENALDSNKLFHEIGHCIYNEFSGVTEITNRSYRDDPLYEIEKTGEGLSEHDGASEFCATAYELYKSGEVTDERYRSLIQALKEMNF